MGRRIAIALLIVIVLLLAGASFAVSRAASPWLRARIEREVLARCRDCTFSVGQVSFSLRPSSVVLRDVRYDSRGTTGDLIRATVPELRIPVGQLARSIAFRRKELDIGRITIVRPDVSLIERKGPTLLTVDSPSSQAQGVPPVRIAGITVENATFTYGDMGDLVLPAPRGVAAIRLEDVGVTVSELGSVPALRGELVTALAHARLESSGRVQVKLTSTLAVPPEVGIELSIDGQDLRDLDPYFRSKGGFRVRGDVTHAAAHLRLDGRHLSGQVIAAYHGLDVDFLKTPKRTGLETLAQHAMKNLMLHPHSSTDGATPATKVIEAQKRENEPYVGFVFRGMSEAALKIAT